MACHQSHLGLDFYEIKAELDLSWAQLISAGPLMWQLRVLLWARLAWDTSAGASLFQVSLTLLQGQKAILGICFSW